MSTEVLQTNLPNGNMPTAADQQPEKKGPPYRALAVLFCLILLAIGLMALPRPTLYYPNVAVEAGTMQIEFLLNGRRDKTSCEAATATIAETFATGCRECRTRNQSCIKNPPQELRRRFDETPLDLPSARIANGIVTYSAPHAGNAPDLALMACRESERQAALKHDQTKVACYPAGTARLHTPFEKRQDQTGYTNFTLLLSLVGTLIAGLTSAILITYYRERQAVIPQGFPSVIARSGATKQSISNTPLTPIIPTHPWLEKFTLAGVDTLVLLSTFLALAWPEADDINRWSHLDRATVVSYCVVTVLTIGWFWLVLEHYARRRPFWDELQDIVRVLVTMFMVSAAAAFVAGLDASRSSQLIVWALNFLLIPLGRGGVRLLLDDLGLWQRPSVIIGTGENARDAYLAIKSERGMGYHILGFINVGRHRAEASANATNLPPPSSLRGGEAGAAIHISRSLRAECAAIHSTQSLREGEVSLQPRAERGGDVAIHLSRHCEEAQPTWQSTTTDPHSPPNLAIPPPPPSLRAEADEATQLSIGPKIFPIFDGSQSLESLLSNLDNPQIILALDSLIDPENQTIIQRLLAGHINIHVIPSIRGLPLFGTQLSHFFSHEVLFLTVRNNLARRGYRWIKRIFDLVTATLLLILLTPLFLVLSYLIRRSGGTAFYGHPRVGRNGKSFNCLKFRSMRPDADKVLKELLGSDPVAQAEWDKDFKLKNDPRITPVGHFLRKTSLDELPQLINVIKGEMSLVGPRPIVSAELERYGDHTNLYLQVLPGVTGLWQVSGRNDTSYAERVSLDAWYVQNWSLWYDIAILFKTIDVVLNKRGAY